MNKQENVSSYLKLEETFTTSFHWNEQKFIVKDAPVDVFDTFISQVIRKIKNVDRQKWELHERWRIINHCLERGVLQLTTGIDGQLLEFVTDEEPEVVPIEKIGVQVLDVVA